MLCETLSKRGYYPSAQLHQTPSVVKPCAAKTPLLLERDTVKQKCANLDAITLGDTESRDMTDDGLGG